MMSIAWDQLEELLWRDPGARGVSTYRHQGQPLAAGQLQAAAESLASHSGAVAIVTGFWVPTPHGGTAETDGPPGALYLARALMSLGREVTLITDSVAMPALQAGCDALELSASCLCEFPFESADAAHPHRVSNASDTNTQSDQFVQAWLGSPPGQRTSHLIAIERAGPSHNAESIRRGSSFAASPTSSLEAEFEREVPSEDRNLCHNMRGESINAHTAKIHRLFEEVAANRPDIATIGIADGGNEIGMGCFPWHVLRSAIAFGPSARVVCRIPTTHAILAGVSNWGGYALALAVCALAGRRNLARPWNLDDQRRLVETIVAEAGAVDGVTRTCQATVDGLPLETYLQPLYGFRKTLGLE